MSQSCSQLSHHIDPVDVCEVILQLAQPLPLLLSALSFCNVHGDADVLTHFTEWIVVSSSAQKSESSIGKTNSVLRNFEVRSCVNCILDNCSHNRLIFGMNGFPKLFEW